MALFQSGTGSRGPPMRAPYSGIQKELKSLPPGVVSGLKICQNCLALWQGKDREERGEKGIGGQRTEGGDNTIVAPSSN